MDKEKIKEKVLEKAIKHKDYRMEMGDLVWRTIDLTFQEVKESLIKFKKREVFSKKTERSFEILLEELGLLYEFKG